MLIWLMAVTIFATIALLTYGLLSYCGTRRTVKERIKGPATITTSLFQKERQENSLKKQFLEWVSSFGKWGVKDREEASKVRSVLIQAGFRHAKGPAFYFGLRVLGAFFLPLAFLMATLMQGKIGPQVTLIVAFILSGAGFYLPQYLLRVITRRRQDRIDKALPDVLDLLIVCMEAGLALTATINRVADEIRGISKDFYNELQLTNAELRTGIPREAALKNLGERTGVQNVKSLVALMIQSEKLGASISQSLRTHASFLRVQRGLKAEEMAAKLPVKILFPMIFFIFPAIFIVVLGPAAIQISKSSFFGS
jgi:tight adherence protein C